MRKTLFTLAILTLGAVFAPAQAEEHIVKVISDYENMRMVFEPKSIHIEAGDTVTWINEKDESHNLVTYPDGYPEGAKGFMSPYFEKTGDKFSHTFDVEGTYEYHCIPHIMMGMHGSVIVGHASKRSEFHKPTAEERKAYRDMMLEFFDEDDFQHMPSYVSERLKK